MGCFSGCLTSSTSIQKLFCGIYSEFKCSFDEFVRGKVVSPSYSSAILGPPLHIPFFKRTWFKSLFKLLQQKALVRSWFSNPMGCFQTWSFFYWVSPLLFIVCWMFLLWKGVGFCQMLFLHWLKWLCDFGPFFKLVVTLINFHTQTSFASGRISYNGRTDSADAVVSWW